MVIRIDKKKIISYLLIYFIIIGQGSVIFGMYQEFFSILFLGIAVIYFLSHPSELGSRVMLTVYGLGLYLLILFVITGGSLSLNSIGTLISRFLIAYVAYYYDEENFVERFVKAVVFLSVVSLIVFLGQIVALEEIENLLPRRIVNQSVYYGGVLATIVGYHTTRNSGLATEPGRYQIYLSVALYFMLFRTKQIQVSERKKLFMIITLIVTILTAQSTTGYVALIILVAGYVLDTRGNTEDSRKMRRRINVLLSIFAILLLVITVSSGTNSFIYRNFINKIWDSTGALNLTGNTGSARVNSILTDMKLALRNPLGMGFRDYEAQWQYNRVNGFLELTSCVGLTRSCATIGFIGTAIILYFYIKNASINSKNILDMIVILLIVLNTTLSQPILYFTPFLVMVLSDYRKGEKNENFVVNQY